MNNLSNILISPVGAVASRFVKDKTIIHSTTFPICANPYKPIKNENITQATLRPWANASVYPMGEQPMTASPPFCVGKRSVHDRIEVNKAD